MEKLDSESMAQKAQQIWLILDDMAENDPSAYRKFIDQQMKEGREFMALPDPHMCVLVTLYSKPQKNLYINFCSWKRVPEPKSSQDPVPVTGIPITFEEDCFALTSVAFNPKVLEEYGRESKNPVDGNTLIQLALDYIEEQHKVKVSRTYTVLPNDVTHKGDFELVRLTFRNLFSNKKQTSQENDELEKMFGPMATESVFQQLSNLSLDQKENAKVKANGSLLESTKESKLIEEIKEIKLPTPKYSLEVTNTAKGRHLVLKIDLYSVKSVSQCELDISEDDVMLLVPGQYELKVKLPSCIDDGLAKAKFCKKTSLLTLSMPIKS